jgi:A/G-specific adenine glycosylase
LNPASFRRALLAWYDASHRDLPWRVRDINPAQIFYRVWLSEIMLQQTRVEAVIPYYQLFLQRFPSLEKLAAAAEEEVLTAWSGLGYYSRARNLHRAAKQVMEAGLPSTYEEALALPGVGVYTAAALASIALNLPHAAVDGNVMRVIARLTNDAAEITAPATRRGIAEAAGRLLDPRRPGDFNQAMMELGATVCLPGTPRCDLCPLQRHCAARAAGTARELPVKLNKQAINLVTLELAIVQSAEHAGRLLLVKRAASERRLANFWELPARQLFPRLRGKKVSEFRHQIVNDRFTVTVWELTGDNVKPLPQGSGEWLEPAALASLPLTTVTKKALRHAGFTSPVKVQARM